jgi:hypothetical protein
MELQHSVLCKYAVIWYTIGMSEPEAIEAPEFIDNALDKLRTDPFGFALVGMGAAAVLLAEQSEASPTVTTAITLAGAGLVAGGLVHLSNMFDYSRRTQDSLQNVGFEQTEFRVRAYCLRQASRVLCEKAGFLDDYLSLCDKTDKLRYRLLPHI